MIGMGFCAPRPREAAPRGDNSFVRRTLGLESGKALRDCMNLEENKDIVNRFGKAVFQKHDFSRLSEYMRDDYIQHDPLVPQGKAGFKQFFEGTFKAIPDWGYTLKQIAAEGDTVWTYGTYAGTHTGREWLGIPATNRKFVVDAVDIFRIQDGKLAEHWDVMDVYGLFKQLGVIK